MRHGHLKWVWLGEEVGDEECWHQSERHILSLTMSTTIAA